MRFESRLKKLLYDISLNPVRSVFVVPEFAWKTKSKKNYTYPNFNGRNKKLLDLEYWGSGSFFTQTNSD